MNNNNKKFAVFDIDGTFFRWQLFHEIIFELIATGHIPKSTHDHIKEKMNDWRNRKHERSWHDYEMAVITAFIECIPNLPVHILENAADAVLKRSGQQVYAYTRQLIKKLRNQGYMLIAISGSQDEIVQRFARLWKFDMAIGQRHDIKNSRYTGTITGDLLVLQKGKMLKKIVTDNQLTWEDSIAVGDSASDIGMLELVEQPIAFNPNDTLLNAARANNWTIVVERKNIIYKLEPQNGTYILADAGTK